MTVELWLPYNTEIGLVLDTFGTFLSPHFDLSTKQMVSEFCQMQKILIYEHYALKYLNPCVYLLKV